MEKSDTVKIYTAPSENNAKAVKSYLENNDIQALIENRSTGTAIFGNFEGSPLNKWEVYVHKEKAEEAKGLLSRLQDSEKDEKIVEEGDITSDTRSWLSVYRILAIFLVLVFLIPFLGYLSLLLDSVITQKVLVIGFLVAGAAVLLLIAYKIISSVLKLFQK